MQLKGLRWLSVGRKLKNGGRREWRCEWGGGGEVCYEDVQLGLLSMRNLVRENKLCKIFKNNKLLGFNFTSSSKATLHTHT